MILEFFLTSLLLTLTGRNGVLVVKLPDHLDSLDIIAQVKHARFSSLSPLSELVLVAGQLLFNLFPDETESTW